VDTGVEEGAEVSPFYDPMIAKMICHRPTRLEAIEALATQLGRSHCYPVKWNAGFLRNLALAEDFKAAKLDTGFIERNLEDLIPPKAAPDDALQAAGLLIAALANGKQAKDSLDLDDTWRPRLAGFRLNSEPKPLSVRVRHGSEVAEVDVSTQSIWDVPIARAKPDGIFVSNNEGWSGVFSPARHDGTGQASAADGAIIAPMPGKVIAVDVTEGQTVTAGQRLMVLEAMKMEHALTAPFDGVIDGLSVSAGSQVQVETVLCRVVPAATD
jgi:3-methylcrotonyl-CoA carboxylase alpha subunit